MKPCYHIDLGLMPYREARLVQDLAHKAVLRYDLAGIVLTCQHPAVITFGKNSQPHHLKDSEEALARAGISLVSTDRGGEVTGHNPGQLVAYPVLHLPDFKMMAKAYVHALEESVIRVLSTYGLEGTRDAEHPGIWLGHDKVCAVGVRFRRRVSQHGLALNVANDLGLFDRMTPCGITGRGVTSIMSTRSPHKPAGDKAQQMSEVTLHFMGAFADVFGIVPSYLPLESLLNQRLPQMTRER